MRPRRPYLESPFAVGFAHRGGAHEGVENSLAAFAHAVDLGFRHLETDVQVTADGVVVVLHDPTLDRTTDGHGLVAAQSWESLRRLRLRGAHQIVRLEELLATFPQCRINIDLKVDAAVEPVIRVINRTASHERVCVASFSDTRIRRFRELTSHRVCTAAGPREVAQVRLAATLGRRVSPSIGADCLQVPVRVGRVGIVDQTFVETAHRGGLAVHVWTVDDSATMRQLLHLGVDGIMTDAPSVLAAEFARQGVWVSQAPVLVGVG